MIIFYPPEEFNCTPVVIADMTDSSDQWSTSEILLAANQNIPDNIEFIWPPSVYSCKYEYNIQHNGMPLGTSLKMTLAAAVKTPPAALISQVSVGFVASARSIEDMESALSKYANPELKLMNAVVVERTSNGTMSRPFVAYSVVLQPDSFGTTATLFIKAASIDDSLVRTATAFQLDKLTPLSTQLTAMLSKFDYKCIFDQNALSLIPVCGRLFQPTTLTKMLDEICLQNKLIYGIKDGVVSFYTQTDAPFVTLEDVQEFSFLGYSGNLIWGVGIENYANVKFRTPIYDIALYDKITLWNDSNCALFTGLNANFGLSLLSPNSYDFYVLRYEIIRNNSELCLGVTASNNWTLAQMRVDGIFESKIYEGAL